MISIIICSRKKEIDTNLSENIVNTVGCEYELIVIDNSEGIYSIFEAYNLGIERSRGDYLCFMHDDILIHTQNWGLSLKIIFKKDLDIGLIGIAGSKIKTKMPSAWWNCEQRFIRMNLKQHFNNGEIRDWNIGNQSQRLEQVVAIDGVFMAAKKIIGIRFHEHLKGFHNYDLNLSFEYIRKGYKVMVTKDIFLEHFSIGKLDKSWYDSTLKIHKIYNGFLPLTVVKNYNFKQQEFKNGSRFLMRLIENKMDKEAFYLWLQLIWLKPVSRFHLQFFKKKS